MRETFGGVSVVQPTASRSAMQTLVCGAAFAVLACALAKAADRIAWPPTLPVYDHIVIVIEENKDVEQILGSRFDAPYIRKLATEGASLSRIFGEEHYSQGNYFWLFSGGNQNVGFADQVPSPANHPNYPFMTSNLGQQLIKKDLSFKGYAESLPTIGAQVEFDPPNCRGRSCIYGRKHVPWISFGNVPGGTTVETSSNLRFADFPADFSQLPTVAVVIPNLDHDMHNGDPAQSTPAGDAWLRENLDSYYQWAKTHNSLLIVTFDENDDKRRYQGLTNPMIEPGATYPPPDIYREYLLDLRNRIVTIIAGANIKPGVYSEGKGITHVNILRTIEAMYGLPKSGAQQPNAAGAGISDDTIITDIFVPVR
ncbi:MAG TPA: alkaline phosphatase family protein [Xanthobacteraceae bacterium]|jgi:acid phosphatase